MIIMEQTITNILNTYPGLTNFFIERLSGNMYCIYFEDGIRINFSINDVTKTGLNNLAIELYNNYLVQSDGYGIDNK